MISDERLDQFEHACTRILERAHDNDDIPSDDWRLATDGLACIDEIRAHGLEELSCKAQAILVEPVDDPNSEGFDDRQWPRIETLAGILLWQVKMRNRRVAQAYMSLILVGLSLLPDPTDP